MRAIYIQGDHYSDKQWNCGGNTYQKLSRCYERKKINEKNVTVIDRNGLASNDTQVFHTDSEAGNLEHAWIIDIIQ